ncbi:hypothetical protein [Aromatoleum evansii]|uniref:Uncharacterized protein n=1 Tax=Aromatoleum evansii TaxID=59406 RepID=A0ABZ1ANX4_AROEV|nr:hypothetical protein [Aromatoleum evansii]NMG27403.1 hypothetical protein [Aromatoleum evansii]WRL47560.1 hypothetical protein U5817_05780 [Aromatoleum evansii]
MSAINYNPGSGAPPELSTEDRRTHAVEREAAPKRRLNDTWFNKVRWPAFLVFWFVMGLVAFAYLFQAL